MHSGTRPGTGLARGFAAPLPPELRHGAALGSAAPWWGLSVGGAEQVGAWPPWARGWHRDSSELGLRMSPWPQYSHPKDTQRTPKGHPMATPLGAPCPGSAGSRSHRAQAPRPTGSPCCAPLPFPPLPSPPLPSLSSPPLRPPLPSPASGARSFSSSFLSFFQFFFPTLTRPVGGSLPVGRSGRADGAGGGGSPAAPTGHRDLVVGHWDLVLGHRDLITEPTAGEKPQRSGGAWRDSRGQ